MRPALSFKMADEAGGLDSFLGKVDEIESIVKALNSTDESTAKDAIKKADGFLKQFGDLPTQLKSDASQVATVGNKDTKKKYPPRDNTGVNRTVINQQAFDKFHENPSQPQNTEQMETEAFMKVVEDDVNQRTARRKISKEKATKLKDTGNEEFKAGNFEKAVDFYIEASTHFKDMTALWTNLAQARLKLHQYEKALEACDWAFRTFDNCLKACVLEGKAYLGLKDYEKAIESYNRALQIDPKKESLIRGYMSEVELARRTEEEEATAQSLFETGAVEATGLVDLMTRVNKADQLPVYYCGGLRLVKTALSNTNERTIFRTKGGLQWPVTHQFVYKCFAASPRSLSKEELDMCASMLDVLQAACINCDESIKQVLELPDLPGQMLRFMETKVKHSRWLEGASVDLLCQISHSELGRSNILSRFDLTRLLTVLFTLMKTKGLLGLNSVGLLNNLALDKKFKAQLRGNLEETVLPAFEALMVGGAGNQSVLPSCISTMTNMCGDPAIRHKTVTREETWQACSRVLTTHGENLDTALNQEVVFAALGLLSNMTFENSENAQKHATDVCCNCHRLLDCGKADIEQRSCGVLSHMMPQSLETTNLLCDKGIVAQLIEIIKKNDQAMTKAAMKCLTACTQHNTEARSQIVDHDKGLKAVVDCVKSEDEVTIGNAALCLSHCSQLPKVCKALTKTNIIMDLLVLARDGQKKGLQHNCAILIAKLAQMDARHLERLRELDGMGILNSVLQKVEGH